MNFASEFESYWGKKGRLLNTYNPERLKNNLIEMLLDCEDITDIENKVCSRRSKKETVRKIIVDFLDYLGEKQKTDFNTTLKNKKFYDYPFERQLEIAKYLHTPHTAKEIEEKFDINKETRKNDIQALRAGIEILGATVKIEEERKGRKIFYRTSMNPVFLPLNLTEVYALTVYMPQLLGVEDPNDRIIDSLSKRIKAQLSDYAFEKLFPGEKRRNIINEYIDDEKTARNAGTLMYLSKSQCPCTFIWKNQSYRGTVKYRRGTFVLLLEDGSILNADIKDVKFLAESFSYK